jgi:hypothetical protein
VPMTLMMTEQKSTQQSVLKQTTKNNSITKFGNLPEKWIKTQTLILNFLKKTLSVISHSHNEL